MFSFFNIKAFQNGSQEREIQGILTKGTVGDVGPLCTHFNGGDVHLPPRQTPFQGPQLPDDDAPPTTTLTEGMYSNCVSMLYMYVHVCGCELVNDLEYQTDWLSICFSIALCF